MVAVDGRDRRPHGPAPAGRPRLRVHPGNFNPATIDEAYWCGDTAAFSTRRLLASNEGLLLGGSSGAAVFIALAVAQRLGPHHNVVAMTSDGGERYPSPCSESRPQPAQTDFDDPCPSPAANSHRGPYARQDV
ncbi:hypothetical protein [Kibdelosporangium philippinense]|uniref:hypothetical protein n=1 Tax=Kibdelosporangium philippinense TaxID=211113 RepID=UPI003622EC20